MEKAQPIIFKQIGKQKAKVKWSAEGHLVSWWQDLTTITQHAGVFRTQQRSPALPLSD